MRWVQQYILEFAKRFLQQAIEKRGVPQKITLDGYAASHAAVAELQEANLLPANLVMRTNRYLNHIIEQDHRRVKQRVRPMLGFKRFDHTALTISGIELVHQIKKGQFDLSALFTHVRYRSGRQCGLPERHVEHAIAYCRSAICTRTLDIWRTVR